MTPRPRKTDVMRHFRFVRWPFGAPATERDFWRSPAFNAALDMVEYAIAHDDVIALCGDVGTSKTVCTQWVERIVTADDARQVTFVRLFNYAKEQLRIGHILEAFLRDFTREGVFPQSVQKRALLVRKALVDRHQASRTGRPQRVVLLVDEAHRLPGTLLKSLKELHESTRFAGRPALFSIVFTGHPALEAHFQRVARDVYDRLAVGNLVLLGDLIPEEGADYLRHRLAAVNAGNVMDEPARLAIARMARTPLELNRVATEVLEAACLAERPSVGLHDVLAVYSRPQLKELLGLSDEQIARMAGLGKSTVNDWINGKEARLSTETRERLQATLQQLATGA